MGKAWITGLCLLTVGCAVEPNGSTDGLARSVREPADTNENASSASPELIVDCVEFTRTAAFVGNTDYTALWNDAGHDVVALRTMCLDFSIETLQGIARDRAEFDALVAASTTMPSPALPFAQGVAADSGGPCDPSYSGACVPISSDVDCGGGEGNGPEFLWEVATVIAGDPYGLDSDGDGLACEPSDWTG